tara:strand:+ start:16238 stop:18097 length:1860 start_codon:yes stop_codon:yes gene_type:complete
MKHQREIKFKEMKLEGFFSIIEPLTYNLDSIGLNLLQGPNGSGKTTILSGLPWTLFGVDLKGRRNPEPWESIQPKNFKGTKTSIMFSVNGIPYEVIRLNNYKDKIEGVKGGSRVILKINNIPYEEARDKGDFTKKIVEILGMDYTIMVNSIIFGQNLKTLVEEKGAKRKEVFDELFKVDYINKAKELALSNRRELEKDLSELELKATKWDSKIELTKSKKADLKNQIASYKDKRSIIKDRIKEASQALSSVEGHKKRIKNLDKKIEKLSSHVSKAKKVKDEVSKLEKDELKQSLQLPGIDLAPGVIKERIKTIMGQSLDRYCGKCRQAISKEEVERQKKIKADEIKAEKVKLLASQITKELANLTYQDTCRWLKEHKAKLGVFEEGIINHGNLKNERYKLTIQLEAVKGKEEKLQQWTANLASLDKPDRKKVSEYTEQIAQLNKVKSQLNLEDRREELESYNWVIDEPLSNSGIKAFIFNERLDFVNERLAQYAPYIGLQPRFVINLDSARKDIGIKIMRYGQDVDHKDLSGGQSQLVDIIALLSIHDVFSQSVDCNIIITDEIFKYLDTDNIQIVSELLKIKSKNKANHVITHNDNLRIRNAIIINVTEDDGRTGLAV